MATLIVSFNSTATVVSCNLYYYLPTSCCLIAPPEATQVKKDTENKERRNSCLLVTRDRKRGNAGRTAVRNKGTTDAVNINEGVSWEAEEEEGWRLAWMRDGGKVRCGVGVLPKGAYNGHPHFALSHIALLPPFNQPIALWHHCDNSSNRAVQSKKKKNAFEPRSERLPVY